MTAMKELFEHLIQHKDLQPVVMQEVMQKLMDGKLSDCQIATFLALLRSKGHSIEELVVAANTMNQYAINIQLNKPSVDIVGTGGDGLNTFNISTVASFVIAAAGVAVAKHGNRSVSSNSGSANFLQSAGINLDANENLLKQMHETCNLCFLFAPNFHPALKHAVNARKELGIRTFFNLLGPLLNPAKVKRQVVGVFSDQWLTPISEILIHLGSERHCVIHAEDGLDEVSIASHTVIYEYQNDEIRQWRLNPQDYGFNHNSLADIQVDTADQSVEIGMRVLNNAEGAARDIVVLNAALAIYVGLDNTSFADAIKMADHAISSGKAKKCFETMITLSRNI